ncbi:MAG: hypothetical protein QOD92_1333 [Acidimicrobiaceae bacterium]|jgi:hypothetical protein
MVRPASIPALDKTLTAAHTGPVAESHWAFGRRVIVEDVRRDDTFMRVTWHAENRIFVVSHWRGEVCVAATRVPVDAAPELVNLLVKGLAESSEAPAAERRPA